MWESTLIITAVSDHASRCACVICQQLVREVNNHDRSLFLGLPASFSLTTPHYTGRVLRLWSELSFLPMSGRSPDTSERLISLCSNWLTHSRYSHMDTWSVFSTLWHHGGLTPAWWLPHYLAHHKHHIFNSSLLWGTNTLQQGWAINFSKGTAVEGCTDKMNSILLKSNLTVYINSFVQLFTTVPVFLVVPW